MSTVILNVHPDTEIRRELVCHFTQNSSDGLIDLMAVEEVYYQHPEAPSVMMLPRTEIRRVDQFRRTSSDGAHCILLEAAQANCRNIKAQA